MGKWRKWKGTKIQEIKSKSDWIADAGMTREIVTIAIKLVNWNALNTKLQYKDQWNL